MPYRPLYSAIDDCCRRYLYKQKTMSLSLTVNISFSVLLLPSKHHVSPVATNRLKVSLRLSKANFVKFVVL